MATVAVLVSCSTPTDEEVWSGTIEVRDGASYVTNPERGLWEDGRPEPVSFVLEQAFGTDAGPDGTILGNPWEIDIDVDGAGNLYVLDGQRNRITAFAPDGTLRWSAGGEGEGPGEIHEAFGIAVSDAGMLAIDNQGRSRLDLWDTNGNFVRTVSLREPPLSRSVIRFAELAGFIAPDVVALGGPLFGSFGSIGYVVRLDPTELAARCEMNERPETRIFDGVSSGPDVRWQDGTFLFGSSDGYVLRAYDRECRLLRVVSRPTDYPVRPAYYEEGGAGGIASFGSVGAPVVLPDGHWLGSVRWVEGIVDPLALFRERMAALRAGEPPEPLEYDSSIDLFDPQGRFLWSLVERGSPTPSIGRLELVGPDGSLYTISEDPFPQVRRYRVELGSGR